MFKRIEIETFQRHGNRPKALWTFADKTEGKLEVRSSGGGMTPKQVGELIENLQLWLDETVQWTCNKCGSQDNYTLPQPSDYREGVTGYKWARCQSCLAKMPFEKMGMPV
jgi:hypothetical protein